MTSYRPRVSMIRNCTPRLKRTKRPRNAYGRKNWPRLRKNASGKRKRTGERKNGKMRRNENRRKKQSRKRKRKNSSKKEPECWIKTAGSLCRSFSLRVQPISHSRCCPREKSHKTEPLWKRKSKELASLLLRKAKT